MKFVWVPGINRYRRTEGEVKKAKQHYEVVEIETDKDSLIDRFNTYEERIEALQEQLRGGSPHESPPVAEPAVETPELAPTVAPKLDPPPPSPLADDDLPDEDAARFDARTLEQQVDALGMLGITALEQFDGWSEITGISASFSRGVHLLNVLAADDHALAKVFLRDRLKKRRKFGHG